MFSDDQNIEKLARLIEHLRHYIELQIDFLKFNVVEKIVRLLATFAVISILFVLLVLALFYLSFSAVYFLEPYTGTACAFGIMALFFFLLVVLVIFKRKSWIERPILRFLANLFLNNK